MSIPISHLDNTNTSAFEVMLAHNYMDKERRPIQNPVGWYMSEKYDGERAIWDRCDLRSRNGNKIPIPNWFRLYLEQIPHKVDGELYLGHGRFFDTGIFRATKVDEEMWEKVKYMAFDIPSSFIGKPLMERLEKLRASIKRLTTISAAGDRKPYHDHRCQIEFVEQTEIKTKAQMQQYYDKIVASGGEGIMLANPYGLYENTRSKSLLKYKPIYDNEAVIVGYKPGQGAFKGLLGSFIVHPIEDGCPVPRKEFRVSGVTKDIRINYKKSHPIGTIITYIYRSLTSNGKPFHPSYKGIRGFHNLSPLPKLSTGLIKRDMLPVDYVEITNEKPRINISYREGFRPLAVEYKNIVI